MFNATITDKSKIGLKGIPYDQNSSFLQGPALAPAAIRKATFSDSANLSTELLLDLSESEEIVDLGDIEVKNFFEDIHHGVADLTEKGLKPIILGGDHSITYPVISALAESIPELTILHLDAHGDLYHDFEGNEFSHASPFARIMENKLVKRLVQVGIRTLNPHQRAQADKYGVEIIEMKDFHISKIPDLASPLYLTLDIDVLDPAFAPGISHYEPGGMSSRDVISIIQSLNYSLVGADIVELNPTRDYNDMTAMAAAKFLKEIIHNMLRNEF